MKCILEKNRTQFDDSPYNRPPKASYGVASPRRTKCTVFGDAPCLKLSVYCYSAQEQVAKHCAFPRAFIYIQGSDYGVCIF